VSLLGSESSSLRLVHIMGLETHMGMQVWVCRCGSSLRFPPGTSTCVTGLDGYGGSSSSRCCRMPSLTPHALLSSSHHPYLAHLITTTFGHTGALHNVKHISAPSTCPPICPCGKSTRSSALILMCICLHVPTHLPTPTCLCVACPNTHTPKSATESQP